MTAAALSAGTLGHLAAGKVVDPLATLVILVLVLLAAVLFWPSDKPQARLLRLLMVYLVLKNTLKNNDKDSRGEIESTRDGNRWRRWRRRRSTPSRWS